MDNKYTTRYTLLERAKDQQDSRAWEEFMDTYKRYIYYIIRTMNINPHDAEDLTQQIIIKMWQKLPEYEYKPGKARFRTWVSLITKNQVISFVRKQKTLAKRMESIQQQAAIEYLESIKLPDIDNIAENEWRIFITNTAIKNVLDNVSEKSALSFTLYSEGVSVADIAVQLNLKEISIYKHISKIKARIIKEVNILKEEYDF